MWWSTNENQSGMVLVLPCYAARHWQTRLHGSGISGHKQWVLGSRCHMVWVSGEGCMNCQPWIVYTLALCMRACVCVCVSVELRPCTRTSCSRCVVRVLCFHCILAITCTGNTR